MPDRVVIKHNPQRRGQGQRINKARVGRKVKGYAFADDKQRAEQHQQKANIHHFGIKDVLQGFFLARVFCFDVIVKVIDTADKRDVKQIVNNALR